MFILMQQWLQKVHSLEPSNMFPQMTWDSLPKSGGSQIHTHFQVTLGPNSYYGNIQRFLETAEVYSIQNPTSDYFTDYIEIHHALGLTIPIGTAQVLVHLVNS